MSLTCPRCGTEVVAEALYCSYCNLPRPRKGFVAVSDGKIPEKLSAPETRSQTADKKIQSAASRSLLRQQKPARRLRLPVVSVAALVALLSVGIYIFVVPLVHSKEAEPKLILSALDKLRRMPSNEEGVTIDARLSRELEKSRRAKNLVSYQGWTVSMIKGTKTRVLLVYSYKEVGDVQQRAEWLADLTNNSFTPQNEFAVSVSPN